MEIDSNYETLRNQKVSITRKIKKSLHYEKDFTENTNRRLRIKMYYLKF